MSPCFTVLSHLDGGDEGIRTPDPLLAGQVLSQLSYTPIFRGHSKSNNKLTALFHLTFFVVIYLFLIEFGTTSSDLYHVSLERR